MPLQRDDRPPPPDLTNDRALADARRRWGPAGTIQETAREGGGTWKHVGFVDNHPFQHFVPLGVAGRWDRAFRDADLAEARAMELKRGSKAARPGGRRRRQR